MQKILLFMQYGRGWQTPSGVSFSDKHPYQLVPLGESVYLLAEGRFRPASKEELKIHYRVNLDANTDNISN